MNTFLLKKEIRLLLPAWGLTLLLAVVCAWLFHSDTPGDAFGQMVPVWLGVLLLCASSFGREFSLGTFSSLLAQPFPRQQFWLIKVGVLAASLLSVGGVDWVCVNGFHLVLSAEDGGATVMLMGVLLLTAVAGGLWLALLVRQTSAVFWLIGLVPGILCVPALLLLSHFQVADRTVETWVEVLLFLYSVAGIVGSWLMFRRAQDAPWSGGVITLPGWLTGARLQPRSTGSERRQVPWRALGWREVRFNQVFLLGLGVLFLLHLGVVVVRRSYPEPWEIFGVLWVLVPLLIGGSSIAEERKLGTMESQLCQPVSTRRQFWVKLGFVLVVGGGLSSLLLLTAEGFGLLIGVNQGPVSGLFVTLVFGGMSALALIGFYASSLAKSLLQALPVAMATMVGIVLVADWINAISGFDGAYVPFVLWNPLLPVLLLAVGLTVALPWLAYRNFRCLHEARRIWRRNGLGILGVVAFSMAASVFLFHRAWEKLLPLEPAHGKARWTLNQLPVAGRTDLYNNLLISLPDGRYWFGCLAEAKPDQTRIEAWRFLQSLWPTGTTPRLKIGGLVSGADWVSLSAGYVDVWMQSNSRKQGKEERPTVYKHIVNSRETVGIRSDGTLWVSEQPGGPNWNTNPLVQFGRDSNWQEVMGERSLSSVLLLKRDGTLWRWGENYRSWTKLPPHWTGLRGQTPRQIGTASDWQALVQTRSQAAVQKKDGSVWNLGLNDKTHQDGLVLNTNLALAGFTQERLDDRKLASSDYGVSVGIHPDGTLWIWGEDLDWKPGSHNHFELLQSGRETNWVAVTLNQSVMVALKSDGTLWKWGGGFNYRGAADAFTRTPQRLGTHEDWVALVQTWQGVVSLAADGSLCLWRDGSQWLSERLLIPPSERPVALGSILAAK